MAAIYIEYTREGATSFGAVRNVPHGACVQEALKKAQRQNPGLKCSIIADQSFGYKDTVLAENVSPGY